MSMDVQRSEKYKNILSSGKKKTMLLYHGNKADAQKRKKKKYIYIYLEQDIKVPFTT